MSLVCLVCWLVGCLYVVVTIVVLIVGLLVGLLLPLLSFVHIAVRWSLGGEELALPIVLLLYCYHCGDRVVVIISHCFY